MRNKTCSQCGQPETDSLQIVSIILPPTINKRINVCRPCLRILIDDSVEKNKAKAEV